MPFPYGLPFTFQQGGVPRLDAYARALKQLLPPGTAFNLESDSQLSRVMYAAAPDFAIVELRGLDLVNETDPRTALETLPEWEAMMGLPDDRVPTISTDPAERRVAITQKYASRGGQSEAFFFALAASCGRPLDSIERFQDDVLRVGFRVNDRVYGDNFSYAIRFNVLNPTTGALPAAAFERVIRHALHAHIIAIFVYL